MNHLDSDRGGRVTSGEVTKVPLSQLARLYKLNERFPAVFASGVCKPLKIGLLEDLLHRLGPSAQATDLSRLVGKHTCRMRYQRALAAGGPRFDLDGQECGEVDEAGRAAALKVLGKPTKERIARDRRAMLLKAFEESRVSASEYAKQAHLDENRLTSDVDRARHERTVRHADQAGLAQRLKDSGQPPEMFAAKHGIPLNKLLAIVAKVAARSQPAATP